MKLAFLFLIFLMSSGCVSKYIPRSNPTEAVNKIDVTFEKLDLNEDGDVTEVEVKNFNESINKQTSNSKNISAPIWATIGIILSTLIMCIASSVLKCRKSE